jgi:hypothetical protein
VPRLSAVQSLDDARKLLAEASPAGSRGRAFYSPLEAFVHAFDVLADASDEERVLSDQVVRRLLTARSQETGVLQQNGSRSGFERNARW